MLNQSSTWLSTRMLNQSFHPGAAALVLGMAVARDRSGWCWCVGEGG
jgi:hypothetical protein